LDEADGIENWADMGKIFQKIAETFTSYQVNSSALGPSDEVTADEVTAAREIAEFQALRFIFASYWRVWA
jgi:hypothetical protein